MITQTQIKTVFILAAVAVATVALSTSSVKAGVIFTESFEDPVISGTWVISGFHADGPWPGWVGVNRYTGMLNKSVNVPGSEKFINSFGDQIAYIFNNRPGEDTGASLTTTPDSLDAIIAADTIYTLTFNTASDSGAAIDYHVELLAIDDQTDPVVETVLGTATGSLTSNDLAANSDSIVFTATAGHANLGERIAIRLLKGAGDWHYNVYYDNLQLDAVDPMHPSPDNGETVPAGNVELSWTNLAPNVGDIVYVDVWFGTDPESLTQVVDGGPNTTSVTVNAPVAGTYYWRVDSYLDGSPTGDPIEGAVFTFYVTDTDGDGLPDTYELAHTSPPSSTALNSEDDLENGGAGDGLTNLQEYQYGTDPNNPDTDGDRLQDGDEVTGAGSRPPTSPIDDDTDDDGLDDGSETNTGIYVSSTDTGTNPTVVDSDGDSLDDGVETNTGTYVSATDTGTNPTVADSDDDGAEDWYEIAASYTDPTDPGDRPVIPYPLPDPDSTPPATTKPVKVYILSGQSNMVGMGDISGPKPGTLETVAKKENKFPNLVDDAGGWSVRNDVWYKGVVTATANKWLTVGCGSNSNSIGPELQYGHVMGYFHDEPVLLIKTSQGNRSIAWDFLPPGSERYTENGITYAGYGDSPDSWPEGTVPEPIDWYAGKQYDDCVAAVHDVLDNFDTNFPEYSNQGYEIAGFVWWQGHKDAQNSVHARRYELNMVNLINAFRSEFDAPKAPFVLATIGFGGWDMDMDGNYGEVHKAQMAVSDPDKYPEFAGNVFSFDTRGYWRTVEESPANQGHHYHRNAETFLLVGDALGRGMIRLLQDSVPSPEPPENAVATAAGTTITVTWDPPSGGPAPTGYEVHRGNAGEVPPGVTYTEIHEGPSTEFTLLDSGLDPLITYCYVVRSKDSTTGATSTNSNEACATTGDTEMVFKRGDVDGNGVLELTDVIRSLNFKFVGGGLTIDCQDAADLDDNGTLELTDDIRSLNFQFSGSASPPEPPGHLTCGPDVNDDAFPPCQYPAEKCE